MNVIRHFAARRLRPALVTTVAAGAGLAGLLGIGGGVAHASVAHVGVNGYVVTDSCTSVAGKISYSPGLRTSKLKAEHAVVTGTTSGCSDLFTERSPAPAPLPPSCRAPPASTRRTSPEPSPSTGRPAAGSTPPTGPSA